MTVWRIKRDDFTPKDSPENLSQVLVHAGLLVWKLMNWLSWTWAQPSQNYWHLNSIYKADENWQLEPNDQKRKFEELNDTVVPKNELNIRRAPTTIWSNENANIIWIKICCARCLLMGFALDNWERSSVCLTHKRSSGICNLESYYLTD